MIAIHGRRVGKNATTTTPAPTAAPLPHEEIVRLIVLAQAGDTAARNRVIEANMRLVTKIAHPMAKAAGLVESLDDLVQSGVMGPRGTSGLMRAIALFDPNRGKRFTTYATGWIRVAVRDAIDEMRDAEVRGGRGQSWERVRQIRDKLATELERKPTQRELKARCVLVGAEAPSDRIIARLEMPQRAAEVDPDALAGEDPAVALEHADTLRAALEAMSDAISDRERRALWLYCGLDGGEALTFEQLGAVLEISRDSARKVVHGAAAKLKRAMLKAHGRPRVNARDRR